MWSRSSLKERARQTFQLNYWTCVGVAILLALAGAGSSSRGSSMNTSGMRNMSSEVIGTYILFYLLFMLIAMAIKIFVGNALEIGGARFFLENAFTKAQFGKIGFGFQNAYMKNIGILFLRNLFIFLWSLLFIVPGVIKSYEYRMIPYILAENPNMSREDAFRISKEMMNGQKMDAFILDLSFLGWYILGLFTCCILYIFYVTPYHLSTNAELYLTLKQYYVGGGQLDVNNQVNYYGSTGDYSQAQNYQNYQYTQIQGGQNQQYGSSNYFENTNLNNQTVDQYGMGSTFEHSSDPYHTQDVSETNEYTGTSNQDSSL